MGQQNLKYVNSDAPAASDILASFKNVSQQLDECDKAMLPLLPGLILQAYLDRDDVQAIQLINKLPPQQLSELITAAQMIRVSGTAKQMDDEAKVGLAA